MNTATPDSDVERINQRLRRLISRLPNRQLAAIAAIVAFGVIGTLLLTSSHATTPTANFETENGTVAGCATKVADSTASGGQAVKFSGCNTGSTGAPSANAGASLPISYNLSSLTGTVVYVATNGSDSNSGSVSSPYATLSKAISAAPSGGTIVIRGGTYRGQANLSISKTLKIIAYPGETPVFNGAAAVSSTSGWTASGSLSYRSYTPMPVTDGSGISFTTCKNQSSSCMGKYPDQVWVGSTEYRQVGSQSAVVSGTFWVDSTNNRLYMLSSDVSKGNIEVSSQRKFATVAAPNVTLEGFEIIRYSNSASDYGVISFNGLADNSLMEEMYISDSAFIALNYAPSGTNLNENSTIKDSTVQYSNWMGISVLATNNFTADHDDISHMNQFSEFITAPQTGSIKTSRTWYTTVKNSKIMDDPSSQGLWFDQSNYDVVVAGNDIENIGGTAVFFEISDFVYAINNYIKVSGGAVALKSPGTSHDYFVNNTIIGGVPVIVPTDSRSIAGCSTNTTSPCGISSDVDQYHTHLATMTWIPSIDLMLNNIVAYPTTSSTCNPTIPFCINQLNSSAKVPLNEIIHPADPTNNVPQTFIDGNVYANGSGSAISIKNTSGTATNYANGGAFATAMAGSPVSISGFEVHSYTGNQYVNSDGSPTSTLSALFGNAAPIPTNATINPYLSAGTRHYGVTWQ